MNWTIWAKQGVEVVWQNAAKVAVVTERGRFGVRMPSGRLGMGVRRGEATEFRNSDEAIRLAREYVAR